MIAIYKSKLFYSLDEYINVSYQYSTSEISFRVTDDHDTSYKNKVGKSSSIGRFQQCFSVVVYFTSVDFHLAVLITYCEVVGTVRVPDLRGPYSNSLLGSRVHLRAYFGDVGFRGLELTRRYKDTSATRFSPVDLPYFYLLLPRYTYHVYLYLSFNFPGEIRYLALWNICSKRSRVRLGLYLDIIAKSAIPG